jgi:hypothetical protein
MSGLSIEFTANMLNAHLSLQQDLHLGKEVTPNVSRFYLVVFAGEPEQTSASFLAFSNVVESSKLLSNARLPITWLTIPAQRGPSAFELLGGSPLGRVYFDQKQTAHARYGVDVKKGAVIVLRPRWLNWDGHHIWKGGSERVGNILFELSVYCLKYIRFRTQGASKVVISVAISPRSLAVKARCGGGRAATFHCRVTGRHHSSLVLSIELETRPENLSGFQYPYNPTRCPHSDQIRSP